MTTVEVNGLVSAGYEPVADVFAENFTERGDTAASCTIYRDGSPVVDLWAGATDKGPWTPDTRTVVFSVSKGITTICILMAVERGLIQLDAPVAVYWPEFAAKGKSATTVRQVLAHRAGLPAPASDLTLDDVLRWDPAIRVLGGQSPAWTPGTSHAYHPFTFGFLAGEVLRRATGKRPNQWLSDHIATPLGVTMSFGVDPDSEDYLPLLEPIPASTEAQAAAPLTAAAQALRERALTLGGAFDAANLFVSVDRPEALACELPGANLVANARGLARVYAATTGDVDGIRLLGEDVVHDATQPQSSGTQFTGYEGARWGTGFMLHHPGRQMAGPGSFGHDGFGGQLAFANAQERVAFAYHTARPSNDPLDRRAEALCAALRGCL